MNLTIFSHPNSHTLVMPALLTHFFLTKLNKASSIPFTDILLEETEAAVKETLVWRTMRKIVCCIKNRILILTFTLLAAKKLSKTSNR